MTKYWRTIQRRLHEESALHYPNNKMRKILESYIDGTLNKYDEDDLIFFQQGFLLTASGSYLDEKGAELGIPRSSGKIATGTVTFKLDKPATSRIPIPKNTIVTNKETGLGYVTTYATEIPEGNTEVTVNIKAIAYGARYNCPSEEITIIETENIPSTVKVVNDIAITGGTDGQTDDEYRQLLFNFISTNLSINHLKKKNIIIYSKKKYNDNIRTKMTSKNPYMSNQYCFIPETETIRNYMLKNIIYYRILEIYIKGWK